MKVVVPPNQMGRRILALPPATRSAICELRLRARRATHRCAHPRLGGTPVRKGAGASGILRVCARNLATFVGRRTLWRRADMPSCKMYLQRSAKPREMPQTNVAALRDATPQGKPASWAGSSPECRMFLVGSRHRMMLFYIGQSPNGMPITRPELGRSARFRPVRPVHHLQRWDTSRRKPNALSRCSGAPEQPHPVPECDIRKWIANLERVDFPYLVVRRLTPPRYRQKAVAAHSRHDANRRVVSLRSRGWRISNLQNGVTQWLNFSPCGGRDGANEDHQREARTEP